MPKKSSQNKPSPKDKLVNLLVDDERATVLKNIALSLPDITLNDRQLGDLGLLSLGAFSPLSGFMSRVDYESVIDRMCLQNGTFWPIPICLDIPEILARALDIGQSVTLRDPEGFLLAILHIEDIWAIDKEKEAQLIYNTRDQKHPGVYYLYRSIGDYYVGGKLEVLNLPVHYDSKKLRNTPHEIHDLFKKLSWSRIIGYPTQHPIHRPQYEITLQAMQKAKANLLILPLEGVSKPGDFDHFTRIRCYQALSSYYPPDSYVLNLLPLSQRMTGYRDILLNGIIAKNYGCTHFLVEKNQELKHQANHWEILESSFNDIGINLLLFEEVVYLPFEDEYRAIENVPKKTQTISLSASEIQERILSGKNIPQWATFSEVLEEMQKAHPPPSRKGFTIFLTGLSGSGKSTVAKVLYSRFQEIGSRPVTLLDGDIVRQNLSSQLSFSKEDRDINVRRIGFVAGEITKNRGIAICAPIAPYNGTRREIRERIETYGGFIEVHVSTPLEECEKRDRKGMYAKARAGLIKDFTGIDDPYEIPERPEVRIDTTDISPDEAAQEILLVLTQKGFIN